MVYCYDFNWNSENGTATVINSSGFMFGKSTCLQRLVDDQNGNWKVQDLYLSYDIPFDVDENSRKVTLYTGKLLTTLSGSTTRYDVYAMPEKWLTTPDDGDDYSDIVGQMYRDGSIEFSDGFAFLIEKKIMNDGVWETSSWELSPIFRNLHLFVPNGKHQYTSRAIPEEERPSPNELGGGLVPRPIKPKPVNPKPVNPHIFDPNLTHGNPGDATTGSDMIPLSYVTDHEFQVPLNDVIGENPPQESDPKSVPVYIYQANDSTIYVYNLYGSNFNWNCMILNHDGTMEFPGQEVSRYGYYGLYNYSLCDSLGDDFLEKGNQGTWFVNTANGMSIRWGDTYFDYDYYYGGGLPHLPQLQLKNNRNSMLDSVYMNNKLFFTKPLNPSFDQPVVTDSTVTFRAAVTQSSGEVLLLLYDPEQDVYSSVPNPYTVYRTDTAYSVTLVAYTRRALDGGKYTYSDDVYFEYEVPALEQYEQGDVNNDGAVDITDVTSLINHVLDTTGVEIFPWKADVNGMEGIDIEDITNLIHRVLYGEWPKKEGKE